jgi:predicted esterase
VTATDVVLVVLHGYEDEPVGRLVPPGLPDGWRVLEPRGPVELAAGPAWFASDDDGPVERDLVRSLDQLDALVEDVPPAARLVVGGSSQGGAVALAWGLRERPDRRPLLGVFAVNGWLPAPESFAYAPAALARAGTRALVVGSADDEVVPVQAARSAARYLERAGVDVTWTELDGGHHIGDDAVAALARWLGSLPAADSAASRAD